MVKRLKGLEDKALELIKKYLLFDWKIKFNKSSIFFGKCVYEKKTIFLSKLFIAVNSDQEVVNTILHEIAHAITWDFHRETGHGETWRYYCKILGVSPEEYADSCVLPKKNFKYVIQDNLGKIYGYTNRLNKNIRFQYISGIPQTLGKLRILEINGNSSTKN